MRKYIEQHSNEENVITQYLSDFDEQFMRDARILLIKNMKRYTPVFAIAEFFDDISEEEIEQI